MINAKGVDGFHPLKVGSFAECENFCSLQPFCAALIYNRYRDCYLKRTPLGRKVNDDPTHRTVMCIMVGRQRCTMENISRAMPAGSKALHTYVRSVYGPGMSRRGAITWNWSTVELVHLQHLPERIRRECSWQIVPHKQGDIFRKVGVAALYSPPSSLWQYQHVRLCTGDIASEGGKRGWTQIAEGSWREVTHAYIKHPLEFKAVFMYAARGSGLWYHTGKTLVLSDHFDVARYVGMEKSYFRLNRTHGRGRGGPEGVLGASLSLLRRRGFDTVILKNHVDWGQSDMEATGRCQRSYYVTEIINIREKAPIAKACPPHPQNRYAGGWNASRPCRCVANKPAHWRTNNFHDARSLWPFAWVECAS